MSLTEGKKIWRRRHYRCRRGVSPGEHFFSVLDNGVNSSEHWRIVDAADDLSWALFYCERRGLAPGMICLLTSLSPHTRPSLRFPFANSPRRASISCLWTFTDAGAASGAGTNYTGSVFCTPDGSWPEQKHADRIERAFESAGMKVGRAWIISLYFFSLKVSRLL